MHTHLQPTADVPWDNISLDLTGATLTDFTLAHCHLHTAAFNHTTFSGVQRLDEWGAFEGGGTVEPS
ncbi:hypothetical protein [Actinomadura sp. 3N508]|uniref:hypothetical protein n=1 Tax=Actinomadura sp. 3N508 TaxID=3375153 RepID=UPI0037B88959